jgi:uncharacterized protein
MIGTRMVTGRCSMFARVVHFEITADDLDRAAAFYRDVFGWEINGWGGEDDYRLVSSGEGAGIDGALMGRSYGQAVIDTIAVDMPVEDVLATVVAQGGVVLTEVGEIPGIGMHAYAKDTEGNVFGILHPYMPA